MSILVELAADIAANVRTNVRHSVQEKIRTAVRKSIALFMSAIGFVFLLVGVALWINAYAQNTWAGHLVVGIVTGITGIVFLNNGNNH